MLKAVVDPNKLVTQWAHDGLGRVTEELRPDKTATTFQLARAKDGAGAWRVSVETATAGGRGRDGGI